MEGGMGTSSHVSQGLIQGLQLYTAAAGLRGAWRPGRAVPTTGAFCSGARLSHLTMKTQTPSTEIFAPKALLNASSRVRPSAPHPWAPGSHRASPGSEARRGEAGAPPHQPCAPRAPRARPLPGRLHAGTSGHPGRPGPPSRGLESSGVPGTRCPAWGHGAPQA